MTSSDGPAEASLGDETGQLERLAREVGNVDEPGSTPDAKTKAALVKSLTLSETYSGSFPHPSLLKQFDGIVNNGAERAFQLTEREQQHRHECERKLVDAEVNAVKAQGFDRRLVIILSFSFLFTSVIVSAVLLARGHQTEAGVVGGASIVSVLGTVFAVTRSGRREDGEPENK